MPFFEAKFVPTTHGAGRSSNFSAEEFSRSIYPVSVHRHRVGQILPLNRARGWGNCLWRRTNSARFVEKSSAFIMAR